MMSEVIKLDSHSTYYSDCDQSMYNEYVDENDSHLKGKYLLAGRYLLLGRPYPDKLIFFALDTEKIDMETGKPCYVVVKCFPEENFLKFLEECNKYRNFADR